MAPTSRKSHCARLYTKSTLPTHRTVNENTQTSKNLNSTRQPSRQQPEKPNHSLVLLGCLQDPTNKFGKRVCRTAASPWTSSGNFPQINATPRKKNRKIRIHDLMILVYIDRMREVKCRSILGVSRDVLPKPRQEDAAITKDVNADTGVGGIPIGIEDKETTG